MSELFTQLDALKTCEDEDFFFSLIMLQEKPRFLHSFFGKEERVQTLLSLGKNHPPTNEEIDTYIWRTLDEIHECEKNPCKAYEHSPIVQTFLYLLFELGRDNATCKYHFLKVSRAFSESWSKDTRWMRHYSVYLRNKILREMEEDLLLQR